jgi:hypothetical protein
MVLRSKGSYESWQSDSNRNAARQRPLVSLLSEPAIFPSGPVLSGQHGQLGLAMQLRHAQRRLLARCPLRYYSISAVSAKNSVSTPDAVAASGTSAPPRARRPLASSFGGISIRTSVFASLVSILIFSQKMSRFPPNHKVIAAEQTNPVRAPLIPPSLVYSTQTFQHELVIPSPPIHPVHTSKIAIGQPAGLQDLPGQIGVTALSR